tara:strand:- start:1151 stop:1576 length:426 start_codon:yes stop_codon:yes gene_type:complete
MMKTVLWILGILLAVPVLYIGLLYGASEVSGEVVTLDRPDANGEVSQVRIWIVEQDGNAWVEHGNAESFWITHLTESAAVALNRNGESVIYVGTPDSASHDLYHQLRLEKYGWGAQLIASLTGGDADCDGLPVRLSLVSND